VLLYVSYIRGIGLVGIDLLQMRYHCEIELTKINLKPCAYCTMAYHGQSFTKTSSLWIFNFLFNLSFILPTKPTACVFMCV